MFQGFTPEALDFLNGIRIHNEKEWFEAHKDIYQTHVWEPLKALAAQLYEPYSTIPDMIVKTARIYKDASFPPYLHYRDTMWIYVRHEAMYWSKTPTLVFEISPDGITCGFRLAKPEAGLMEQFRKVLLADAAPFLQMVQQLEAQGIVLSGEEYKRAKPCPVEELLPYFKKKSICAEVQLADRDTICSCALTAFVQDVFAKVFPLHEYFQALHLRTEAQKCSSAPSSVPETDHTPMVRAPRQDFMW